MNKDTYRGKRKDNNQWVYGAYLHAEGKDYHFASVTDTHAIIEFEGIESGEPIFTSHEVCPETVGRCIGDKDANGVDIFDGDIVDFKANYTPLSMPCGWLSGKVVITNREVLIESGGHEYPSDYWDEGTYQWEVTGSIHDNPTPTSHVVSGS